MATSCIDTGADSIDNCPTDAETTIGEDVFAAKVSDLVSSPQPVTKTAVLTAADWLTTTGTFVFESGKCFSKLEATKSPEYDGDLGGEKGGRNSKASLMVPLQRTPAALGFAQKNKNANLVVVFKDGNGRWCIFGFKGRSASIAKAPNKLSEEAASLNITFEANIEAHYLPDNFTPQITPQA